MAFSAGAIVTKTKVETLDGISEQTVCYKKDVLQREQCLLTKTKDFQCKVGPKADVKLKHGDISKQHHSGEGIVHKKSDFGDSLNKSGETKRLSVRENVPGSKHLNNEDTVHTKAENVKCQKCLCCSDKTLLEEKMTRILHQLEESLRCQFTLQEENKRLGSDKEVLQNRMIELSRELEIERGKLLEERRLNSDKDILQRKMIELSRELEIERQNQQSKLLEQRRSQEELESLRKHIFNLNEELKSSQAGVDIHLNCQRRFELLTVQRDELKAKCDSLETTIRHAKQHCQSLKNAGDSLEKTLATSVDVKTTVELEKENEHYRKGISNMEAKLQMLMKDFSMLMSPSNNAQKWEHDSLPSFENTEQEKPRNVVIAPQTFHITSPQYVSLALPRHLLHGEEEGILEKSDEETTEKGFNTTHFT